MSFVCDSPFSAFLAAFLACALAFVAITFLVLIRGNSKGAGRFLVVRLLELPAIRSGAETGSVLAGRVSGIVL